MFENSYNCVTVSTAALQHNYNYIKAKVGPDVSVMAMVKADGYGHDMVRASRAFADAGCDIFGVAELCEAVELRTSGISGRIFVMLGFEDGDSDTFFEHELTPVIFDYHSVQSLSDSALKAGKQIGVHIKVDTGMSRLGVKPEKLAAFMQKIERLEGISIGGILSHFPESDNLESKSTEDGFFSFTDVCYASEKRFNGICHIANSGAVLNFPNTHCDMVRPGIALYGYHPAGRQQLEDESVKGLIPAMSFSSRVLQVNTVAAGTGVSYGHTFTTDRETRLAVLPVGYEDGYSRILSNRGEVLIHGKRAPIRGRICMNICMADVTDIGQVSAGDEVVFLGGQGDEIITADDIAEKMGSISYEVLCLLGNNNKRDYRE
jgi:alanine racemase